MQPLSSSNSTGDYLRSWPASWCLWVASVFYFINAIRERKTLNPIPVAYRPQSKANQMTIRKCTFLLCLAGGLLLGDVLAFEAHGQDLPEIPATSIERI